MKKTIQITGHEIKDFGTWKKHIVFEDRTKYEFGEKKKNGDMTKAYEQWQVKGYGVGTSVVAEVAEEEVTYTNKEGKEITYTRRTILYFVSDEDVMVDSDAPLDLDLSAEDEVTLGVPPVHIEDSHAKNAPGEKTLEEKVNILWKEHENKVDSTIR